MFLGIDVSPLLKHELHICQHLDVKAVLALTDGPRNVALQICALAPKSL